MAKGLKTGGRSAGTPNRRTREITELLRSLDCNPIEGMVLIAQNEQHTPELRGRMFAELAQYLYPKRRATELSAEDGQGEITITWGTASPEPIHVTQEGTRIEGPE
jgi:hypothetical protein